MWHRLLHREQAALEWGWTEGMCFCLNEEEDFMMELMQYIWRGNTSKQKKSRAWTVTPLYREKLEWFDFEWLSFKKDESETKWVFTRANHNNHDVPLHDLKVLECQRLRMVHICFDGECEFNALNTIVYFMTSCCNKLEAYYYVNFGCWCTRCGSVQECVSLFDVIASNIARILYDTDRYYTCIDVVTRLSGAMRRRESCDPVRLAYMHWKIGVMKQELMNLKIISL